MASPSCLNVFRETSDVPGFVRPRWNISFVNSNLECTFKRTGYPLVSENFISKSGAPPALHEDWWSPGINSTGAWDLSFCKYRTIFNRMNADEILQSINSRARHQTAYSKHRLDKFEPILLSIDYQPRRVERKVSFELRGFWTFVYSSSFFLTITIHRFSTIRAINLTESLLLFLLKLKTRVLCTWNVLQPKNTRILGREKGLRLNNRVTIPPYKVRHLSSILQAAIPFVRSLLSTINVVVRTPSEDFRYTVYVERVPTKKFRFLNPRHSLARRFRRVEVTAAITRSYDYIYAAFLNLIRRSLFRRPPSTLSLSLSLFLCFSRGCSHPLLKARFIAQPRR